MTIAADAVSPDLRREIAELSQRIARSDIWAAIDDWFSLSARYNDAARRVDDDDVEGMVAAECGFSELSMRIGVLVALISSEPGEATSKGASGLRMIAPEAFDPANVGSNVARKLNELADRYH